MNLGKLKYKRVANQIMFSSLKLWNFSHRTFIYHWMKTVYYVQNTLRNCNHTKAFLNREGPLKNFENLRIPLSWSDLVNCSTPVERVDISVINALLVFLIEPLDSLQTIYLYECNKAFSYLILLQPLSEMRPSVNRALYSETDI